MDTLHKKNLLLLGEDRYLTTLMLKTFPKRKMMFCSQAVCKTIVPDTFKVLLSQRRRWINSTVHNLFELVLVNDLCGVFCLSMRFMIAMELVGTLVLPAALAFTFYVVGIAIKNGITGGPIPVIPLVLLAIILGLPGVLIVVTSRKWSYVGWMGIYLLSLPVWNLVLPTYAFWHFDDFSWGATRIVQGEGKGGGDHSAAEGTFDASNIVMKRWADFERGRRLKSGWVDARDSTWDVLQRTSTPADSESYMPQDHIGDPSGRYSVMSSDTYLSGLGDVSRMTPSGLHPSGSLGLDSRARSRAEQMPLLELPAPLARDTANRGGAAPPDAGSIVVPRPSPTPSMRTPAGSSMSHATSEMHSTGSSPLQLNSPAMVQAYHARQAPPRGVSLVDNGPFVSPPQAPNLASNVRTVKLEIRKSIQPPCWWGDSSPTSSSPRHHRHPYIMRRRHMIP